MNDANYALVAGGNRTMFAAILISSVLSCAGCRPATEPREERPAPAKSSAALLVDGITGKYAVDAGKRAKADIEAIAKKQEARLKEVLEE